MGYFKAVEAHKNIPKERSYIGHTSQEGMQFHLLYYTFSSVLRKNCHFKFSFSDIDNLKCPKVTACHVADMERGDSGDKQFTIKRYINSGARLTSNCGFGCRTNLNKSCCS